MKLDINFISILLVAFAIFPYILLPYIQYRSTKKLKSKFRQEAINHKLNIDLQDSWNLNIIGTDLKEKKLLFVQRRGVSFFVEIIDLSKVMGCLVKPELYKVKSKGKDEDILQRVNLEFSFLVEEEKIVWTLYDCDINFTQDLEIKHAEKWCNIIQNQLIFKPILQHTA